MCKKSDHILDNKKVTPIFCKLFDVVAREEKIENVQVIVQLCLSPYTNDNMIRIPIFGLYV